MHSTSGIDRLAALYQLVETNRSVELRIAASALLEVKQATAREILVRREQARLGRIALLAGEPEALLLASLEGSVAERRGKLLLPLEMERQQSCNAAADAYRLARLQHEQMQLLVANAKNASLIREARQVQAQSDDRFASRGDWLRSEKARASKMSAD